MKLLCLSILWLLACLYACSLFGESPVVETTCSIRPRREPSGNLKFHVVTTTTRQDGSQSVREFAQSDKQDEAYKRCKEFQKIILKASKFSPSR